MTTSRSTFEIEALKHYYGRAAVLDIDRLSIAYFGASEICNHKLGRLTWLAPRQPAHGWIAVSEMYRAGLDGGTFRNGDMILGNAKRITPMPYSSGKNTRLHVRVISSR